MKSLLLSKSRVFILWERNRGVRPHDFSATTGKIAANTASIYTEAASNALGSGSDTSSAVNQAFADGTALEGVGGAAASGAVLGALGSSLGDAASGGFSASSVFGAKGTLSPAGVATGTALSNTIGNVSPSDMGLGNSNSYSNGSRNC